jgi:hypothetical protein
MNIDHLGDIGDPNAVLLDRLDQVSMRNEPYDLARRQSTHDQPGQRRQPDAIRSRISRVNARAG